MSKYGANFKQKSGKGIVLADGFSVGQDKAQPVYSAIDVVTLAELNAGKQIIPDIPNKTIKIVGFLLKFNGGFTTATDIRLQDSAGTVITTVAIAAATTGAKISSDAVVSNVTDGAGLFKDLTAGKGVKIVKTGSAAAGGTDITVKILFNLI